MTQREKINKLIFLIIAGFSVLAGYNFIRSISVPLFIANYGKDRMPEATMFMGILLFLMMMIHGKLLTTLGAAKTCLIAHLLSFLTFLSCYFGIIQNHNFFSYILFMAKDIYVVILIEHYWSYFNSTYHSATGKKISGIFTGFVSVGPILSGYYVTYATPLMNDPKDWIWLTALTIIPSTIAMFFVYQNYPLNLTKEKNQVSSGQLFAWNNFHSYPQLKVLAWMVIITQIIAASTTFAFNAKVAEELVDVGIQTAYYGTFYSNINLIAGIIQFLLAPLLLHFIPATFLFLFLALSQLSLNIFALWDGSLFNIMLASLLFKSFDYSIFRCAKELFYMPLNFTARFHSKHLIDVFFYRASNSGVSTFFTIAKSFGTMQDTFYTLSAAIAASCWFGITIINRKKLPKEI